MIDYYSELKLSPDVSHDEIANSFNEYKNAVRSFSPGINISDEEIEKRNPKIWIAYQTLLNVETRKEYDARFERDRIHQAYEAKLMNIPENQVLEDKQKNRWFFSIAIIVILMIVFFINQTTNKGLREVPSWRSVYPDASFRVMLPSEPDTLINLLPPYLLNYVKRNKNYYSELRDGFSVSVSAFELGNDFKISPKDIAYVGSKEMQNSHLRNVIRDTSRVRMIVRDYRLELERGQYQIDDIVRAYENYTLINGSSAIKLIINYVPGNTLHEKYCQVVFASMLN